MKRQFLLTMIGGLILVVASACVNTAGQPAPAATPTQQMAPVATPTDAMPGDSMSATPNGMQDGAMGTPEAMDEDTMMDATPEAMDGDTMMGTPEAMDEDPMMEDSSMGTPEAMSEDSGMSKDAPMGTPGAMLAPQDRYVAYSPAALADATARGSAVLFFKADWCPTCRAADADFKANLDQIPANVTVLQVNYDTESDLKSKYRIIYQHTFVQVDASGDEVTRWSGGGTRDLLESIS